MHEPRGAEGDVGPVRESLFIPGNLPVDSRLRPDSLPRVNLHRSCTVRGCTGREYDMTIRKTFSVATAVAAALGAASPVLAGKGTLELEPVTTTATLAERDARELLTSISKIDREAFERQQPRDVTDLMRGRPGIDVVANGPFGKTTSVFTRGIGTEGSLLLVDGVRMGSATTGGASWQFLPPQLIEEMEIVRGPRGSLYGADAVGGVVQAFTREGEGPAEPWVQAGVGSFGSQESVGGVSGSTDNTRYNIAGSSFDTDGIRLTDEEEDRSGYRNNSGVASIAHSVTPDTTLGATALHSQGRTEFIDGLTDFVHQSAGTYVESQVRPEWETRFELSRGRDDGRNQDAQGDSRFETVRLMADWRNTLELGDHEWIIGADWRESEVSGSTDYAENRRDNSALYNQVMLDFTPVDLEASLRYDDNEAYGSETTGALAAAWDIDGTHRLRASHGTAFRAPTFNDLYFPGFGNPDLQPETSATTELGITGRPGDWYWDVVAYETEADDLIQTVMDEDGMFLPQNVAEARIQGIEFSTGAQIGDWSLYGSASYTDPEDRDTGNRLRRRHKESARIDVDRDIGDWSLGGSAIYQGNRYDDAENEQRLSGFNLFNLRAGWNFAEDWQARLTVDNVFDEEYTTALQDPQQGIGYNQPGRSFFVSLRYGAR